VHTCRTADDPVADPVGPLVGEQMNTILTDDEDDEEIIGEGDE
jgi:hypothetical protein